MQQAVRTIKSHLVDKGHQKKQRDETHRVFRKADHRRDIVGVGPEQQQFIGGPYGHAAHQGVKHVVVGLVVEEKGRRLLRPLPVVFEGGALLAPDIEPQVPCAVDQNGQDDVTEQNQSRPAE